MDNFRAKEKIVEVIRKHEGLKLGDLLIQTEIVELLSKGFLVLELIDELVKEEKLVKVEYTISDQLIRVQRIFLVPINTEVVVTNNYWTQNKG